ncbi:MAG: DUF4097 family beta strand repeat protein [Clostridia bacterium]|nr:DUF4097 family beta strand repeat protein [Clostridia bacterium]
MKKAFILAGIALILVGAVLFAGVSIAIGFDYNKLDTQKLETNTHTVSERFKNIDIGTSIADIRIKPSEDGSVRVVCVESEKLRHTVSVENETLKIALNDTRGIGDHIGLFYNYRSESITLYMPEEEYDTLYIKNSTGDTEIPSGYSFESITASLSTGSFVCEANVSGLIKIKTTTGSISLNCISAGAVEAASSTGVTSIRSSEIGGSLILSSSTGRVELEDVSLRSLISESSTGTIRLKNVVADENILITRSTGDVHFENCDAASLSIKTSTGDVNGTLKSGKRFTAKTSTGDVNVPQSSSGGDCDITTTTGDIKILIVE